MENRKINPYKIPEGYFDKMQDKILERTNSKNDGFSLPKDYFENLQNDILVKVRPSPLTIVKRKTNYRKLMAAASTIFLFATLGLLWNSSKELSSSELVYIQEVDADIYLSELSNDINIDQLVDLLEMEDIENINFEDESDFDQIQFLENLDLEDLEELL